jgi:hypothetical protein
MLHSFLLESLDYLGDCGIPDDSLIAHEAQADDASFACGSLRCHFHVVSSHFSGSPASRGQLVNFGKNTAWHFFIII